MVRNSIIILLGALFMIGCKKKEPRDCQVSSNSFVLSNPNASNLASNLYTNLGQLAQKKTLFGHHESTMYGVGWWAEHDRSDVKSVTGSYPAIFSWDIAHIGESNNINGVSFDAMRTSIIEMFELGGIHTCCWHMPNPVNESDSWDTTPAIAQVLPQGNLHANYKNKLQDLAVYFNSLQSNSGELIPIIFRPFHEMSGDWFWWGKGNASPEDYIDLWHFTKDYLEDSLGVNHLIWCYSTDVFSNQSTYFEFYPGDDYVDILAFDDYQNVKKNNDEFYKEVSLIVEWATEKGKIAGVSETGLEKVLKKGFWTNNILSNMRFSNDCQGLAFVIAWRNASINHYYVPFVGHPEEANFRKFYEDEQTVFLNNLPYLYN